MEKLQSALVKHIEVQQTLSLQGQQAQLKLHSQPRPAPFAIVRTHSETLTHPKPVLNVLNLHPKNELNWSNKTNNEAHSRWVRANQAT